MLTRPFGRLGVEVSCIGLGTAQLANTSGQIAGIKHVKPEEARHILESAIDLGVSFLDTGDQYGHAEELIGALDSKRRSKIIVGTKAGLRDDGKRDFSPEYLKSRLERSLKKLKTDCIDLFQLNKPSKSDWQDGTLAKYLETEKKRGRIRFAGVIVGEAQDGLSALNEEVIDTVQVLFHLMYQTSIEVIDQAARKKKGVIVRSPLNSGLLSGAYNKETIIPKSDERSRYFVGQQFNQRLDALEKIQNELAIKNENLVEFALNFCLSQPGVSTVIPGASTLEQMNRYVACGNHAPFDTEYLKQIKLIAQKHVAAIDGAFQLK